MIIGNANELHQILILNNQKRRKMKMKRILSLILSAVMLVSICAIFSSCADDGKLTMATNAQFPPYEYMEGDKFVGIDVEIAQKIAEKLGMELEIIDTEFNSIIGGVQSGKYDIGMAGMTVNEDRLKNVNFSKTYATGVQVVIVKDGGSIKSLDDLAGEGVKIGVQEGTTGHIYAADTPEKGGYGKEAVIAYKTGALAVQGLISGKVQAVIIDNEPAKNFVKANEGLSILETKYVEEEYAIAVAKNNNALLEKINKALDELIADGTVQSIIDKYIPAE